jgi:putative phage-type endonuclease
MQQSADWLEMRKTKIGASDAPVIMLESPWKTPFELWQEKLGIIPEKARSSYVQNYIMNPGLEIENKARLDFFLKTGVQVTPKVVFHDKYEWMMASLDGIDDKGEIVLEIKSAGKEDHFLARNGKIPPKYYPQLQHQMELTKVGEITYNSVNDGDNVYVQVKRDDKYIKRMIDHEEQFYDCMSSFIAPKLCERDFTKKEDDIWRMMAGNWLQIQEQMEEMEKKDKEIRERLIFLSNGRNSIGGGVRLSKIVRKGAINYDEIEELKSLDLERYRKKPSEYWKITKRE